jgi:micrococcal nuclease
MRFAQRTLVRIIAAASLGLLSASASAAGKGDVVRGPVEARVERVLDGDTFVAVAQVWPGHSVRVSVRIRGIDAPETKSRCAEERAAGEAARQALEALFAGAPVAISNIGGGKYYGRVLADVASHDGRDAAETLLGKGLARQYSGGRRAAYC